MPDLSKSPGLAAAWVLVLALAACSDDAVSGGACNTNQDCPMSEQCVGGRCVAATVGGCRSDDDCVLGEFCDPIEKVCKPVEVIGCSSDEACPPEQRCNIPTGVCVDGRRNCTAEGQCAMIGLHCDLTAQQCVQCTQPSHCTAPDTCVDGDCTDPSQGQCTMDPQCGPPANVCQSQQCVPGCGVANSPIRCGLGSYCNTTTGRCDTGQVNCSNDTSCNPPASICENTQCIPGCAQVGGLQCTGGYVCNQTTGRCEAPTGCTSDPECGAPAAVCENRACVPGCGRPGGLSCGAGTVCDTNTGRCVPIQGPCQQDSQCSPPQRVCELGQCVPGCAQVGGIQCSGNTTCNQGTGRCDTGQGPCTNDSSCSPPSTICNTQTGACDAGCNSTGCMSPNVCNTATGHCYDPGTPTGGQPLNAACTAHDECASNVCFDFGGSIGQRCVAACGNSLDCPASFTCYDYNGGKMCVSSQLFSSATFATPNGGNCQAGAECHSNYCPDMNQCVDTCSENSDCGAGQCKWSEFVEDVYIGACDGPAGSGANGTSCSDDSNCRGGVCYGQGTCGDLCGSTADCGNGYICVPVNYSACTLQVIACLQWQPNFVKACVQATHGTAPIGSSCASGNNNCRDGLCHLAAGQCTGTCSRNADCPGTTHVCGVEEYTELSDGTKAYVNVCRTRE